jgi:hypothetical protein
LDRLPEGPTPQDVHRRIAWAERALEDAIVLASCARAGEPPYAALVGNVRTTATELARLLVSAGRSGPDVRGALRATVTRGAARGCDAPDGISALLAIVDRALDATLDRACGSRGRTGAWPATA